MPITTRQSPEFKVGGPLLVPLLVGPDGPVRVVDSQKSRAFLQQSEFSDQRGCYIFSIANGQRVTPWYVGKAGTGFAREVFNDSNCKKYAEALAIAKNGKPQIYFIILPNKRGKVNGTAIDRLETFLVAECGVVNPDIRNRRKSAIYVTVIAGVMNSGPGKPNATAASVRKLMGRQ